MPPTATRQQQQQQQIQQIVQQQFSGPLPLPQMLQGYEEIVPGSAERILKIAEDEAVHRRGLDRSFVRYRAWSLVVAATGMLLALGGGIYLSATGHSITGLTLIISNIAALVAVFLVRQFRGG